MAGTVYKRQPGTPNERVAGFVGTLPGRDELLDAAERQRARLYLVGGAVRDLILGGRAVDVDLAVEGDAIALADLLDPGARVHERFGTASIRLAGRRYDLATARAERYAEPGALPTVRSAPIAADLARRDFTVNAIAAPLDAPGELIDPQAGLADLRDGLLRVLHEGSFRDDPTRVLRAARYLSRLGFALEPTTARLLGGADLATVSAERIEAELLGLAAEPDPIVALGLLVEWGQAEADLALATVALELASGPPWEQVDRGGILLRAASVRCGSFRRGAPERARKLAAVGAAPPSELTRAARGADPIDLLIARALGAAWTERYVAEWAVVRPQITGSDLLAAGVEPGPAIGRGLEAALTARLDEGVDERERQLEIALAAARTG